METPKYLRTSTAGAIGLGFQGGQFYRDAKIHCLNLLMTYKSGCGASCAYCGLASNRNLEESELGQTFIRVPWPTYGVDEYIERLSSGKYPYVERVCFSMITNRRCVGDLLDLVGMFSRGLEGASPPVG
ncbi:MAG: radical SAM protein, partial [Promethearchaeota archaeon]